jgi:predicted  nucleic acid-binding Zn-ribbon protein
LSPTDNKDLAKLLAVQVIDQEILALKKERRRLPESISAEERVSAQFEERVQAEKKRHEDLLRQKKQLELEIDACLTAIQKFKTQQFQVKKNEEYLALGKEIADKEHEKELIEEKVLNLIEEVEALEAVLVKLAEERLAKKGELDAFRQRVAGEVAEVDRKLVEVEGRRAEMVSSTPAALVGQYDRIRTGKPDGVAVTLVERDACSGCHARVPPQKKNELLRAEKIVLCEACGRILVYDPKLEDIRGAV